ncbi:unnamed protein product, partial [Oppiella nova]
MESTANKDEVIPMYDRHPNDSGDDNSVCAVLLTIVSIFVIAITMPLSLFFCIKVVQEYERAVIFRLGRL